METRPSCITQQVEQPANILLLEQFSFLGLYGQLFNYMNKPPLLTCTLDKFNPMSFLLLFLRVLFKIMCGWTGEIILFILSLGGTNGTID